MRPDWRVRRDFDGEFAAVRLRFEDDAGRVNPDLWWPRLEFADGGDGVRGACLDGDGKEVIERGNSGVRIE
jgi:hypothetical protein